MFSRKAHSKYKPHPIFGSTINPLQPIIQFFSPKKSKPNDRQPSAALVHQDSIVLPGSYPLSPKLPHHPRASSTDPPPPTARPGPSSSTTSTSLPSSSNAGHDRRKKRLERTKTRMGQPTPRHATSGPKGSIRSRKSKSFERMHKDVNKTLKPMSESMNEDDKIFLDQMEKILWTHKYRTGLVECRDTAERAPTHASDKAREHDEKIARLMEEEKEVRVKLERQASEEWEWEEARRVECEQRRAEIKKATRVVEEKAKQGEIKRERTRELIRVLNKSELDIMASVQAQGAAAVDQDRVRVELEKIAEARRQLQAEQAAYRHQFDEIAAARAELEESKRRMQQAEEASRAQAAARAAELEAMFQGYRKLQHQIRKLQDDKEAAQRKSDDVLLQARAQTKRLKQEHARALREKEEAGARRVAETVVSFQARLLEEAEARRWAEQQAAAATAAAAHAEAAMFAAASGAHQHQHRHPNYDPWQPPPEYEMASPPPASPPSARPTTHTHTHHHQQQQPRILTESDRITLYERKWEALKGPTETIFFDQIPWPVLIDLTRPDDIDIDHMRKFLNHQVYLNLPGMAGKSLRDRIKGEMLRWHPDKFARVLPKVDPAHRAAVKEAAEEVVKLFTQIMRERQ